ncbi:MAG: hypothetical protein NWF05_03705 [Candidatus Bathyarchaeota archaeon]|nr:hypothetical protein [Candidatus Bathyarchaeota archaeon]
MTEQNQEKTKKKYIKRNPKYPLPDPHLSFEKHIEIIKAYVVISKNGAEGVSYKSFKTSVDISPTSISGNNEFFKDIGLIKEMEGQRGKYLPSEKALKLYNALKWSKDEEIRLILRDLISDSWFWKLADQLLELKGSITRTALKEKLGYESDADPKKHNISLNILTEYLIRSGLVSEEDGELSYGHEFQGENETQLEAITQNQSVPFLPVIKEKRNEKSTKLVATKDHPSIIIGVLINPEMPEEQIRSCVRIIMDEWEKLRGTNA